MDGFLTFFLHPLFSAVIFLSFLSFLCILWLGWQKIPFSINGSAEKCNIERGDEGELCKSFEGLKVVHTKTFLSRFPSFLYPCIYMAIEFSSFGRRNWQFQIFFVETHKGEHAVIDLMAFKVNKPHECLTVSCRTSLRLVSNENWYHHNKPNENLFFCHPYPALPPYPSLFWTISTVEWVSIRMCIRMSLLFKPRLIVIVPATATATLHTYSTHTQQSPDDKIFLSFTPNPRWHTGYTKHPFEFILVIEKFITPIDVFGIYLRLAPLVLIFLWLGSELLFVMFCVKGDFVGEIDKNKREETSKGTGKGF